MVVITIPAQLDRGQTETSKYSYGTNEVTSGSYSQVLNSEMDYGLLNKTS
jgi:hypothetical protein